MFEYSKYRIKINNFDNSQENYPSQDIIIIRTNDPYKLFVDLVIQPENVLTQKNGFSILENIAANFEINLNKSLLLKYLDVAEILL